MPVPKGTFYTSYYDMVYTPGTLGDTCILVHTTVCSDPLELCTLIVSSFAKATQVISFTAVSFISRSVTYILAVFPYHGIVIRPGQWSSWLLV